MKFEELKNNLKSKIEPAYLLMGVDEFLLSSAYNLIVKYSGMQMEDLNLIKFGEGIIDMKDVVRALNTLPVFCDKKIVYLDIRMSKLNELKNIKDLQEYLECPNMSSVLIVNLGSNDIKFIDKNIESIDCNRLGINIVSLKIKQIANMSNKNISEETIKLLYDYTLGDLAKITVELNKLISYVGDKDSIEISDIKELVTPSLEYQVFELTDALAKKNSIRVYQIISDMKAKKDEFRTLPAIIFSHFRRLFMVTLNQDKNRMELSKLLGVKEYAVKMSMQQAGLFSKSQLKKINELLSQVDFDLKQSNMSIDNAVGLIVLKILNI
ncbi:MAG TPA: DNA polymerase III subunit delta [Clostridiales bacterium]|nr:DNA polymerase III subunit delta [Clostridiales bacterium]